MAMLPEPNMLRLTEEGVPDARELLRWQTKAIVDHPKFQPDELRRMVAILWHLRERLLLCFKELDELESQKDAILVELDGVKDKLDDANGELREYRHERDDAEAEEHNYFGPED